MTDLSKSVMLALSIILSLYIIGKAVDARAEPDFTYTAPVYIDHNNGGRVSDFIDDVERYTQEGIRVEIRGNCWSSCTLYLSVPSVCIHPSASFHFHAPYREHPRTKRRVYNERDTKMLTELYPPHVQRWLDRQGGLGRDWLHFYGDPDTLATAAPLCTTLRGGE